MMSCNGQSGYLLTGIKVEENKNKRKKVEIADKIKKIKL